MAEVSVDGGAPVAWVAGVAGVAVAVGSGKSGVSTKLLVVKANTVDNAEGSNSRRSPCIQTPTLVLALVIPLGKLAVTSMSVGCNKCTSVFCGGASC